MLVKNSIVKRKSSSVLWNQKNFLPMTKLHRKLSMPNVNVSISFQTTIKGSFLLLILLFKLTKTFTVISLAMFETIQWLDPYQPCNFKSLTTPRVSVDAFNGPH